MQGWGGPCTGAPIPRLKPGRVQEAASRASRPRPLEGGFLGSCRALVSVPSLRFLLPSGVGWEWPWWCSLSRTL